MLFLRGTEDVYLLIEWRWCWMWQQRRHDVVTATRYDVIAVDTCRRSLVKLPVFRRDADRHRPGHRSNLILLLPVIQYKTILRVPHFYPKNFPRLDKDHFLWLRDVAQQCTIFYLYLIKLVTSIGNIKFYRILYIIFLNKNSKHVNWKAKIRTLVIDNVIWILIVKLL